MIIGATSTARRPLLPVAARSYGPAAAETLRLSVGGSTDERALGPMESLPYEMPYTGKGVGIAIIDSGIAPHPDLQGRIVAFVDAVDGSRRPVDPLGHGTHVAGDAAGSGAASGGRFRGASPGANLIGIRVLDGSLEGDSVEQAIDSVVAGLEWMVENKERYNIRVANLSLGLPLLEMRRRGLFETGRQLLDPIKHAIDQAVGAGIVVVVAAGNDGERGYGSIDATPATNPSVITVGALDTHGTPPSGDDEVAPFSSRGPTPDGRRKPDVIAPGANVMSLNAPGSELEQLNLQQAEAQQMLASMSDRELARYATRLVYAGMLPEQILYMPVDQLREVLAQSAQPHQMAVRMGNSAAYIAMDGTSMASPIVAGICANVIEANPDLTPAQVKQILMKTARPLRGEDEYAQGAGVVDAQAAVALALKMRQYPSGRYDLRGQAPVERMEQPMPAEQKPSMWERLFGRAG